MPLYEGRNLAQQVQGECDNTEFTHNSFIINITSMTLINPKSELTIPWRAISSRSMYEPYKWLLLLLEDGWGAGP